MTEFANGLILVLFGGIKIISMIAELLATAIFAVCFAIYFIAAATLLLIQDACDCILHHQKPDDFFGSVRELWHLTKDSFYFGLNYNYED